MQYRPFASLLASFLVLPLFMVSAPAFARAQSDLPPPPPPPLTDPTPPPPQEPVATPPPQAQPPHEGASAPIGAEAPPPDEAAPTHWKPMMQPGAGAELYWFSAKNLGSTFTLIPHATFQIFEDVLLDVHVPIAIATDANLFSGFGKSEGGLGLGNPTLGLTYVTTGPRTSGHVGLRISAPLAGASDAETWQIANYLGAISMTLYDLHYWAYKYVPIGARIGFEHQPKPGMFFRGDIEPTVYVPVDDDRASIVSARKTSFFYQMRLELEGRSDSGWGGGAGIQLVHMLSESNGLGNGDNAQGGFEPFVSYDSSTAFARLGLLLGVDSPLGFGLDQGKVAALRANVGSHF